MKYKNIEIGIPTVEQIQEYVDSKNMTVDTTEIYEHFQANHWLTKKNTPITSIESMVNSWNGVHVLRVRRHNQSIISAKQKYKRKKIPIPYRLQLQDKRWFNFRRQVLNYRGHICERCGETHNLQVHHREYQPQRYAWEYKMKDVIVLCKHCHEKAHCIDLDKEFMKVTQN